MFFIQNRKGYYAGSPNCPTKNMFCSTYRQHKVSGMLLEVNMSSVNYTCDEMKRHNNVNGSDSFDIKM